MCSVKLGVITIFPLNTFLNNRIKKPRHSFIIYFVEVDSYDKFLEKNNEKRRGPYAKKSPAHKKPKILKRRQSIYFQKHKVH